MPRMPKQKCKFPGCPHSVEAKIVYCDDHARYRTVKKFTGFYEKRSTFYDTARWKRLRRFVLSQEPLCRRCGRPAQVVDHIRPIKKGGSATDLDNLQPLCTPCHNAKSSKDK